jgi:hypothetical protein
MTMRVSRLSALCIAAAALTASASASAHFYAYIDSAPSSNANNGMMAFITTDTLHSTCNLTTYTFVNHEMWYNVDQTGNHWVEVGLKDGETNSALQCKSDTIFWADSRNGGGYNEHYFTNGWTLGDRYEMQVTAAGSCTWNVVFGGLNLGNSTNNCPGSGRFLLAGIEATNQGVGSVKGFLDSWEELNGSGTWIPGWDGAFLCNGQAGCSSGNPPEIKWIVTGSETEEVHGESW